MDLFRLVGSVFIDTNEANNSLSKTEQKASSVGANIGKAVGVVGGLATAIVGVTATMGASLLEVANQSSQTADEIDKMSQKIGLSNKAYQEWDYIMGQNGMDVNILQTGMKTLSNLMDSANSGTQSAIDTFNKLGVSIYDSNGALKSQEEMLNESINALANMEASAERTALGVDLFGKSATEMTPMLNQGADAITELRDRSHELGLIMSDEAVTNGVAFGDLMDDLKQSASMLATNLGSSLFPVLNDGISMLIEFMPTIQGIIEQIAPILANFMAELLPIVANLVEEMLPILLDAISSLVPILSNIVSSILPVAVNIIQTLLPPIMQLVTSVLPIVVDILDMLMPIISELLDFITPILALVIQLVSPLLKLATTILKPILDLVARILEPLTELLSAILEPLINVVMLLIEPLTQIWGMILPPIIDLLMLLIEPLLTIWQTILTPLFDLLQMSIEWLSPKLTALIGIVNELVTSVVDKVQGTLQPIIEGMKEWMGELVSWIEEKFVSRWKEQWETVSSVFSAIWDAIVETFKTGVNFWIDGLNKFIDGINAIKIPDWVAGIGGLGFEIPHLQGLYTGGYVTEGGMFRVGEKGAETVMLPSGSAVIPHDAMTKADMTEAMVEALTRCSSLFSTVVENNVSSDDIFKW